MARWRELRQREPPGRAAFLCAFCTVDVPAGAARARSYDKRRGDVGIAPYEKAAGKPCVGADAYIRPHV